MTAPNILLICTDQHRYDALGAAGNPAIETPNLDRLAAQGVMFENAYVTNTVCAPSRASLMTGRYVPAHGLYANGVDLPDGEVLVSRTLADAGYDCGLVGKLHLSPCEGGRSERRHDDGLRVFRWAHAPVPDHSENAYHRWLRAKFPELRQETLAKDGPFGWPTLPREAHYSHWVAEETIDFLCTDREEGKPFFFISNFFDPHFPFAAPEEYRDRYDGTETTPVHQDGELDSKPEVVADGTRGSMAGRQPGWASYPEERRRSVLQNYYAMVTLVDEEIGRILDTLDETGLAEDTIVVMTSDHGEMLGDHDVLFKGPFMYEGAVRVPFLVRWPGVAQAGARRTELVQLVDLAPTFLDAARVDVPERMQGSSLRGLVAGDETQWRDWAICHYRDSGHPYPDPVHATMLRHDRWKLIVWHGSAERARTGELYDLADDPGELVNLWDDPGHRDVRLDLQEQLIEVMVAVEDRSAPREANW